jgi:serine protease Do
MIMQARRLLILFVVLAAVSAQAAVPEVSAESQSAVVKAVKLVGPAVVNIDTLTRPQATPFDLFFFGEPQPQQGQGSGWIIDGQQGYIVTNEHVIHNADEITVTLPNKKQYTGKLIGSDRLSDIAVVKIEGQNLQSAKLSNGSDPVIGSWAIAIGNPFGFQNTVTVGVISAIIPQAQGMGFAIPAGTIQQIVPQLIKYGKVIRPWVGFVYRDLTPKLARQVGIDYAEGVIVFVYRNSNALKAGLNSGDIVVEAAGKPVKTADELAAIINPLKIGDKLPLVVVREGAKTRLSITVAEMP